MLQIRVEKSLSPPGNHQSDFLDSATQCGFQIVASTPLEEWKTRVEDNVLLSTEQVSGALPPELTAGESVFIDWCSSPPKAFVSRKLEGSAPNKPRIFPKAKLTERLAARNAPILPIFSVSSRNEGVKKNDKNETKYKKNSVTLVALDLKLQSHTTNRVVQSRIRSEITLHKAHNGYYIDWPQELSHQPKQTTKIFFSLTSPILEMGTAEQDSLGRVAARAERSSQIEALLADFQLLKCRVIHIPLCGVFSEDWVNSRKTIFSRRTQKKHPKKIPTDTHDKMPAKNSEHGSSEKKSVWADGWILHTDSNVNILSAIPPSTVASLEVPLDPISPTKFEAKNHKSRLDFVLETERSQYNNIIRQSIVSSLRESFSQGIADRIAITDQSLSEALWVVLLMQAFPSKKFTYTLGGFDRQATLTWKKFCRSLGLQRIEFETQRNKATFVAKQVSMFIQHNNNLDLLCAIATTSRVFDVGIWHREIESLLRCGQTDAL